MPQVAALVELDERSGPVTSSPDRRVDTAPAVAHVDTAYSIYALVIFAAVNAFILMDRQILTVLAEDIKADLRISDADLGFIFGTAISVFYAIFSIPLGRCADVWTRKNLLALCVTAWSMMIFLTGSARSFLSFALVRVGVGVGEAGAAPAGMSMLSDFFSPRLRSTAMSVSGSGVPLGAGLGVFLGGFILDAWNGVYPDAALAPFGLKGWQAAFFCIALPGPLLALCIYGLKEPVRGQSEGLAMAAHPHPLREVWAEVQAVLPVLSLFALRRLGGGGQAMRLNLLIGGAVMATAVLLIALTGSIAQWTALGLGVWCVACWAQTLALRDRATFAMIFKCPALLFSNIGLAGYVFVTAGVGTWIVPFLIRAHHVSASEVGAVMGLLTAIFGVSGAMLGGFLADLLDRHTPRARLYVALGSLMLTAPSVVLMLTAKSTVEAYIYISMFILTSSAWYGIGPSIANGLVMPRMRGVSSAFYLIVITLLGVAMGPYTIGFISDQFVASGMDSGESLRRGMLWALLSMLFTAAMLLIATVNLARDDGSRLERARTLGEPI